ncbi:PAS domain-containing protein [Haloplanus natans]|uniref:PAS domain-containing protein n=1 Tax=Haloplanus natans TaxID=376171 RepID=UPI0006779DFF|nr:PAS domain-containing protein [Haloplanus natans]
MSPAIDSCRLLHVDDDPSILSLTEAFLDRELDCTVTTVTSVEAALDRLAADDVDCIVSDYDMPEMDGLAFFETLRDREVDAPFVLYTGKGSEEIASQALNAGVTGYFQKGGPEQLRRLANRVRQAVEESRTRTVADRYSTVMAALGYPIYVVDETGHFEFVNEPFAELTGYDVSTVVGSKPGLVKDDDAVARAADELGSILSSEGPSISRFEVDIVPKEGEPIRCRDHMAALPYEGDSFEGSVGILRDISTERRRARELGYRTRAMDEAPVGITMSNPDRPGTPLIYVNDRFVEMTGYDREAMLGRDCLFLQGAETTDERIDELRAALAAGDPVTATLRNYRRDGEKFWNRLSLAPLEDEGGNVARWVGFQEDVTAHKRYQRRLERQNARLERTAGVLSHDLRNPLTVAKGRLDVARDEVDSDDLDAVADAHGRIEALVDDLLALVRNDDDIDTEPVSLATVAETCWAGLDTGTATLRIETDRTLLAEPGRFERLLTHLLGNAVEHDSTGSQPSADNAVDPSGDGGPSARITVGGMPDGFYVADDGPGVESAKRERIVELGGSDGDGAGFGLSIVEEFAGAHDWTVGVTTSETGGARFEVVGVDTA